MSFLTKPECKPECKNEIYDLTHVDLFAGIGGFSLAFEAEGFRTVGYSENNPTPPARDFKDTPNMATTAKDGRERDDQLPRRIYGDESVTSDKASRGGMRLTPEFLCWLMGYPENWLKPLRAVPVTQLCRKSSNPLPAPSTNS